MSSSTCDLHRRRYYQHIGITLSADNRRAAYIPKCCAHGFLTLEQNSEDVVLHVGGSCACKRSRFRWDDPAFKIAWPAPMFGHVGEGSHMADIS